jgi:hypothetical protein
MLQKMENFVYQAKKPLAYLDRLLNGDDKVSKKMVTIKFQKNSKKIAGPIIQCLCSLQLE